jgi:mRNA interferase MazF
MLLSRKDGWMKRGDIILSVVPGDYGKPRPTVIVQNDRFNAKHDSIVICPLTSHLTEGLEYRIRIQPALHNGLSKESELMIDKIAVVRRDKLRDILGHLTTTELQHLDTALKIWFSLS